MKLYVYNTETNTVVAVIEGESNKACEAKLAELNYDNEGFAATYSPAFGFISGLRDIADDVPTINA